MWENHSVCRHCSVPTNEHYSCPYHTFSYGCSVHTFWNRQIQKFTTWVTPSPESMTSPVNKPTWCKSIDEIILGKRRYKHKGMTFQQNKVSHYKISNTEALNFQSQTTKKHSNWDLNLRSSQAPWAYNVNTAWIWMNTPAKLYFSNMVSICNFKTRPDKWLWVTRT